MKAFARLLDRLSFSPARNVKLTLLRDYLSNAPDPERGWALASLTGELSFRYGNCRDGSAGSGCAFRQNLFFEQRDFPTAPAAVPLGTAAGGRRGRLAAVPVTIRLPSVPCSGTHQH